MSIKKIILLFLKNLMAFWKKIHRDVCSVVLKIKNSSPKNYQFSQFDFPKKNMLFDDTKKNNR